MGQAIGQVVPYAVGVGLSPIPIIAVLLMLDTPRGRSNGPAFLLGWVAGLTGLSVIVLLLSNGAGATDSSGAPATWTGWLKVVLGLVLARLALKQWRGRPRGDEIQPLPAWMDTIDHFTPRRSAAIGVALSAINPKNLILTVGAAAAVAQAGVSTGSDAVAIAVFVVIGTMGCGAPVALYFALGERATQMLADVKTWMARENATIMTVLFLIIGAKLIGDGITVLTA
jgi:hypothetical protein